MIAAVTIAALLLQIPLIVHCKGPSKCELCREIVDGFKKGLQATQGSNFGGGNTKWEEKHLGRYLASETRFVEVTEKYVCKDSADEKKCHMMFEETEPAMEDWWFRYFAEGASPDGLYEYLCIEQVKACCPKNTFGKHCSACPGLVVVADTSKEKTTDGDAVQTTESCSGRGDCEGSGTRHGSGSCSCQAGYRGRDCSRCADRYFEPAAGSKQLSSSADGASAAAEQGESSTTDGASSSAATLGRQPTCLPCHQSCTNSCRSAGPDGCDQCRDGWTDSSAGCTDVNECETVKCQENEFCENTAGSYNCIRCHKACSSCFGMSDSQCLSCAAGYRIAEGGSQCSDIDECMDNSSICPPAADATASVCTNSPGSYVCDCADGYKKHPETGLCAPAAEVESEAARQSPTTTAQGNGAGKSGSSSRGGGGRADGGGISGAGKRTSGHSAEPKQGRRPTARPIDRLVYFCSILMFVVMAVLARGSTFKMLTVCAAFGAFLAYFASRYQ